MSLRKMRVDMDDVLDAMRAYGDAPFSYFDTDTGHVEVWLDPDSSGEQPAFDLDDERWVEIPRQDARDLRQAMHHFAEGLDDEDVAEDLRVALRSRGAFRNFRGILVHQPELRERWQAAHQQQLLDEALIWLREVGIEPQYELRAVVKPPATQRPGKEPARPLVGLFDLLLLGAPNGKTELLDGRVSRMILLHSASEARGLFAAIARELTEHEQLQFHKRFVEGRNDYDVGRFHLSVEGNQVWLDVEVPRAIWDAFG